MLSVVWCTLLCSNIFLLPSPEYYKKLISCQIRMISYFSHLEQNVWSTGDSVRGSVSAWHTNGSLIRILRARQDGFVKLVHANRVGELVNSPRMPQSFIWLLLVHHGRIDLTAAIWEMSLKLFFRCLNSNG